MFHTDKDGDFYLGPRGQAKRDPGSKIKINPRDIQEARDGYCIRDVIRAYIAQIGNEAPGWVPYMEWCKSHEEEFKRPYQPNFSLITDKRWARLPEGARTYVQTNVNKLRIETNTESYSLFDYAAASSVNTYHTQHRGGSVLVQHIARKSEPALLEEAEQSVRDVRELPETGIVDVEELERELDEELKHAKEAETVATVVTNANNVVPAKRVRVEDEDANTTMGGTPEEGKEVEKNRRIILTRPPTPSPSGQTAKAPPAKSKAPVAPEVNPGENRAPDRAARIREVILKTLSTKVPVTLGEILEISPEYKEALVGYINTMLREKDVIEYRGSSEPGEDTTSKAPVKANGPPSTVKVNLNKMMDPAPSGQTRKTVPFHLYTTFDGQYAAMKGGMFEDLLTEAKRLQDLPDPAQAIMKKRADTLSFTQKMEVGVLERTHALPTLYCQFENPIGPKYLALIDSGSECNCIHLDIVKRLGIPMSATDVTSQGLHGTDKFAGECYGKLYLAGQGVNCFFFVTSYKPGGYDMLLGMPFLKTTSLTFDYEAGRLVTANINIGSKLIKAHVVSNQTSRAQVPA
jgi:hypothetical protein